MKYIQLTEVSDLADISQLAPFKVLLSIDNPVSDARQQQIAAWLVEMGALHVTIRGEDCLSWKDSIRAANLDMVNIDQIQPEQFVMITTHPFEGLASVFKQLKKYARHTHVELNFTVIAHVARQNYEIEYQSNFSR